MANDSLVKYFIDGVDLRSYGVFVSKSQGLLDRPAIKDRTKVDWPGRNGIVMNHNGKRLQERVITLSCFVKANGKRELVDRITKFNHLFDADGQRQLIVDIGHPNGPLVYMVDCEEQISVEKTWSNSLMAGTFELRLLECEPVKRLFLFLPNEGNPCSMKIRSQQALTIHWGDGSASYDVMTKGIEASDRTYEGEYASLAHNYDVSYYGKAVFVVVAGDIDALAPEDTDSNAELRWLQY